MSNHNYTNDEGGIHNGAGITGTKNSVAEGPPVVPGDNDAPTVVPGNNAEGSPRGSHNATWQPTVVSGDDEAPPVVPGDDFGRGADADNEGNDPEEKNPHWQEQLGQANRSTPEAFTPEMQQWLTDNRDDYEFYMLHAILHDPLRRSALLQAPLLPDDFTREEYAVVIGGLRGAVEIMRVIGGSVPCPPTSEWLRTYISSAARKEGSDDEMVGIAMRLVTELGKPEYAQAARDCVAPYFPAWYSAVRAKKAARALQRDIIPDVRGILDNLEDALAAAAEVSRGGVDDPYETFVEGTSTEREPRKSTGIHGLDESLNGGWGVGECYLLFGGTSSGKSIAAGQCAWHEAKSNDGYPLIVSTELLPREYGARLVSCGCNIPISPLQDCENFAQIRQAVETDTALQSKLPEVEEALQIFKERIYISKVSADEGMDARAILKREALRYEKKLGHKPTWVCLDWLGSVADVSAGSGRGGASERAMVWEHAANGCVKFAEASGIPTLVLAQAVNDAQTRRALTINEIGISKGIGKNMTAVIGLGNSVANAGKGSRSTDITRPMFLENQLLCVCKSRKGEGRNIPIRRDFNYQRFVAPQDESTPDSSDESARPKKPDATAKLGEEIAKAFGADEVLPHKELWPRIGKVAGVKVVAAKARVKKALELGLVEKKADGRYRILRSQSA